MSEFIWKVYMKLAIKPEQNTKISIFMKFAASVVLTLFFYTFSVYTIVLGAFTSAYVGGYLHYVIAILRGKDLSNFDIFGNEIESLETKLIEDKKESN